MSMASDPPIFSPSASSFLTAPSVVDNSSPAEPDSPSSSTGGLNGIVAIDSASSERWTCSDYSDFTALSAVSSATPSILSVNSSMPGTSVPTAPHSPVREAVDDYVHTNSASIDTIRGGPGLYDSARTNKYSLLRFIGARPAPSGSGSGPYSSFEFPTLDQTANVATQLQASLEQEQQRSPSSFAQPYPMPQHPGSARPSPPLPSFSPPATVSTNLFEESRQPSPAPSESVNGLAEDLMAFSIGSSSNELPERHPPTEHGASSSTTTSTLRPSPPTPTNPPSTVRISLDWPLTASPEPLPEPNSQPATLDQSSGVNPADGASIPHNATTASGGFSHTTAERWPFMGSMDHLMRVRDAHSPYPYEHHPAPPEVQTDAQHPAHEPTSLFGQLNAGTPSTAILAEQDIAAQQPPAYALYTPPTPGQWLPSHPADTGANAPSFTSIHPPPANEGWVQTWPIPPQPLYELPDSFPSSHPPVGSEGPPLHRTAFGFIGQAGATPPSRVRTPEDWQGHATQTLPSFDQDFDAFTAWCSSQDRRERNLSRPRLPYRVPSPRPITPTMTVPPGSSLHGPPSFGCNLFEAPTPSSDSESFHSSDSSNHSGYGPRSLHRVSTGRQPSAADNQGSIGGNGLQSADKGKGRLAVNTDEARQAYERAVQARKNYRPVAAQPTMPGPASAHPAIDVAKAQKAYEDAIQARDRLVQRTYGFTTTLGGGAGAPHVPADPDSSSEEGSVFFAKSPNPGGQQSQDHNKHPYFPSSDTPKIQIVPGPGQTTIVIEQNASGQNPAASLEAIPVVPGQVWTAPARSIIRGRSMPRAEEEEKGEGWKAQELVRLEKEREALLRQSERLVARQRELSELPGVHYTSELTDRRGMTSPSTHSLPSCMSTPAVPVAPQSGPPIQFLPFIPPSRTSSASSMYTGGVPATHLHCQRSPSPSSRSSSPDTPEFQPRRRSRSFRRTSSTHTHTAPAVTFVLPQPTTTDQTGPSCSSTAPDTTAQTWNFQSPNTHPGMSSGKLSTLNFNESTRPSPWVVPPTTFSTMDSASAPAPSINGWNQCGFGTTPAANPPAQDNQSWPFGPMQNVTSTPAQMPAGWAPFGQQQGSAWPNTPGQQQGSSWPNTPGQQQGSAWQQPAPGWGSSWATPGAYPGYSPNFWLPPPQAPIMCNTMLPPSTCGTLGRSTSLPYTQSTALPTYPLPTGQYTTNNGIHSQFMPPLMGLPPYADPWGTRSAPPPYNGSPSGWGNPTPGNVNNMQGQPIGMSGANTWGSMARYPLHPRFNFPDANVSFLVRGIEYRVHRYFFEKHSNQMKDMLATQLSCMPNPMPLTVDGVNFEKLLSIFYPSNPLESDLKDADDMARAIRAAKELGFQDICKSVIELAMKLSPVERILLSREHDIKELAISGYTELCASGKPVSPQDGEKLGAATIIKVWEVQQLLHDEEFCRSGCRKEFLESTVKQKFGLE